MRGGRLPGSAELVQGAPVAEVALRPRVEAIATKSLVLGFAQPRVNGQLEVGRAPIWALAKVAVKAKRAYT